MERFPSESGRVLREDCTVKYAYIDQQRRHHPIRVLCKMLNVHPSGFYGWIKNPLSQRAIEDARQTVLIKDAWTESGKPSVVVDNTLDRQFNVNAPDRAWVTDITYIRTQDGFAYLCVVLDLFSRRVVGWALHSRPTTELVVQALLSAI